MNKFIKSTIPGLLLTWIFLGITLLLFIVAKFSSGEGVILSWLLISQLSSLLGTTLLAITFILTSRWSFVEGWFGGLDRVYKYHHLFGGFAFTLLLHHPLFLILDIFPDTAFAWKYLWLSDLLPYNWGLLSLYSMMLMLIFTLLIDLPYSLWKKTHEFMGLALLFACLHVLTITSDVSFFPLMVWLVFLLSLAFYSVIYRRFLYEIIGPKYQYFIKSVVRVGDVHIIEMVPESKKIRFHPGQFVFARFLDIDKEDHPFSIASGPDMAILRIVAKRSGDYTGNLGTIKVGGRVIIWGPYGQFGEGVANEKDLIWVAGGIGVTPFLSLLSGEVKNNKSRRVDIFYCVGTGSEAIFDPELRHLSSQKPNLVYHQYISSVEGHLDVPKIIKICNGVKNKKIMLCGPVSMMNSLTSQLKLAGVKNQNIIFEDFNLK